MQVGLNPNAPLFVEALADEVPAFDPPVQAGSPPNAATLIAALSRQSRSSDELRLLRKHGHTNIVFIAMPMEGIKSLIDGRRSLVASAAGESVSRRTVDVDFPFPPPGRSAFRLVAQERLAEVGVEHRDRKRKARDLSPGAVERRVLWVRAGLFARDQGKLAEAASAMKCAFAGDWGDSDDDHELEESEVPTSARTWARDLIRIDGVCCLLQRREVRREPQGTIRGFRCDASPKLQSEVMATEIETIYARDMSDKVAEAMPGSTLMHGLSKLPHKVFMVLWGFLVCGPSEQQLRYSLSTVRWVLTDFGVESSIASASDCVSAFMHWAQDRSPETSPPVAVDKFLLPNVVFLPGWNHAWANLLQAACESMSDWPTKLGHMRRLAKFLRIGDYRHVFATALRRHGVADVAKDGV